MTMRDMAEMLWPAWLLGLIMFLLVKNSKHADLLRVDKKGLRNFAWFLFGVTAIRFVMFKYLAPPQEIAQARELANLIPWQACLMVYWEDLVHVVPLAILGRMFAQKRWYQLIKIPLLILVMIAFGSGHVYQGFFAAFCLSFYIPYTLMLGKKYGFGTIILCHMSYDLTTTLFLKWMLGS